MSSMSTTTEHDHGDHTMDHTNHHGTHPPDHDGTHPPDHNEEHPAGHLAYFHGGTSEIILFKFWETDGAGGFVGSFFIILCIGFLYEGVKFLREYLFNRYIQTQCKCAHPDGRSPLDTPEGGSKNSLIRTYSTKMLSWFHVIQSLLHMVQFVIAYLLMLIFMTYNVWLCLAVTLGSVLGYFFFGWKKSVTIDLSEHCH